MVQYNLLFFLVRHLTSNKINYMTKTVFWSVDLNSVYQFLFLLSNNKKTGCTIKRPVRTPKLSRGRMKAPQSLYCSSVPKKTTCTLQMVFTQHFQIQLKRGLPAFQAFSSRFHPLGSGAAHHFYQKHSKQVHIDFGKRLLVYAHCQRRSVE